MNNKHLLSLLQSNFRTVHVIFGADLMEEPAAPVAPAYDHSKAPWDRPIADNKTRRQPATAQAPDFPYNGQAPQRSYVYKCHNDLDIKQGDSAVVIDDRGVLKLVTVVKVDDFADIDLNADFSYKWIVDVVRTDLYKDLMQKEQEFSRLVTEAQRAKLREETLNAFKAVVPQEGEAGRLFNLAFGLFGESGKPDAPTE